ncbi:NAD(P)-dependent alcohol dehydrogenase [Aliidiomarina indica]|uniref:NAD(P)-dependent alcohol dehydrogenase n=1 Tax=Aliidiomarina indica TaxID=2749147 RepID=UPI00188E20F5|nr:NAD(P)-dependent alcohol dehydrogenase [Aliidiomarina indica]
MTQMRAVLQNQYGEPEKVLSVADVAIPTPKPDEVLVRVRAASVHPDVWHVVTGYPRVLRLMGAGLRKPKQPIPGIDMAGEVVSLGSAVTHFSVGDAVFGETHREIQWVNGGAFAEYVCVPEDVLAHKPENVTFEQAASVPTAGMIFLNNLKNYIWNKPGQRIVINGAAGGVGSIALQIAKAQGAYVIGIDHTSKIEFMRSLGADYVLDYTCDNLTHIHKPVDLIIDIASTLSVTRCKPILQPQGKYVMIGHDHYGKQGNNLLGGIPKFFAGMLRGVFDHHLPKPSLDTLQKRDAMTTLASMLANGTLAPVIARTFSLSEVPLALTFLQTEQVNGRIVIVPSRHRE